MGTAAQRRRLAGDGNNPQPVIVMDRGGNDVTQTGAALTMRVADTLGTTIVNVGAPSDAQAGGNAIFVLDRMQVYNGATWDRMRGANVFKPFSVSVVSLGIGPQTVWTPTSGKRFRLMGVSVTSDKAQIVNFRDSTVASIYATGKLLALTPAPVAALGNGALSASVNNVLTVDVDGGVPVALSGTVWGTEE